MKSIYLKKQGANPKNKILDFLIVHSELDYSLKEISKYSDVSYSAVKILINNLLQDKWVVVTRKLSKIKLYKLNINNPEVKKFIEFYWTVIEQKIKSDNKSKETNSHGCSLSGSLLASAKSI